MPAPDYGQSSEIRAIMESVRRKRGSLLIDKSTLPVQNLQFLLTDSVVVAPFLNNPLADNNHQTIDSKQAYDQLYPPLLQ